MCIPILILVYVNPNELYSFAIFYFFQFKKILHVEYTLRYIFILI